MLRLYRLGLALLPPGFRRSYGRALLDEAAAALDEAPPGAGRRLCGARLGVDLTRALAREWVDAAITTGRTGMGGGMIADVRWALRALRRAPGYALAIVGTLGLGIGASTAAFGLADAYLLRSLPYPESERLMVVWPDQNWSRHMVAMAREHLRSLEDVGGVGGTTLVLQEGGPPEELFASEVTTNFLDVMRVKPLLGRGFLTDDGAPGAEPVAVLAHALWAERFGSDPSVIGRTVALGGDGHLRRTVVGVMPPDHLPFHGTGVDAWVPVTMEPASDEWDDSYFMTAVARLAADATPARAAAETRGWAARVRETQPGWFSEEDVLRATATTLAAHETDSRRTPLGIALAAALLVLLVACANVANLVVARTTARERELSVRAALGAGRVRTARVVGVEVATLAAAGGLAGLAVALGLVELLERRLPAALPAWGLTFDLRWIAVALCMSGLAAAAAGLVPALHAARRDPARVLAGGRGSSHGRGAGRFQELMSASQLALATAGIAAVGLLGRSLADLARVDMGFEPGQAVTFRVTAPPEAYPGDGDVVRFFREVRAALAAVPSVERVGLGSRLPLAGGDSRISANPEGWQREEGAPAPEAWHRLATPGYLEALGVALLDGRIPGVEDDRDDLPQLAVVNRAAAERFWPGESAVGKRFYGPGGVVWLTVAGVVEDVRERGQQAAVIPGVYIPHRDWPWRTMYAVVRTRDEPMSLLPALQEAVRSVSAGVPISRVETLDEIVDGGLRPTRMLIAIAAVAGIVTLLLGGLGVYGVVSHAVARRRRELGVRAALGAGRGRLLRGAMGSATRIVALGLGAGLVLAWMAGRGLQAVLPGVDALDVPAFAAALAVLGSVAYAAAFLPARRAARVDPVQVMREE